MTPAAAQERERMALEKEIREGLKMVVKALEGGPGTRTRRQITEFPNVMFWVAKDSAEKPDGELTLMMKDLLRLSKEQKKDGSDVYEYADIIVVIADSDYRNEFKMDFDKPFDRVVGDGRELVLVDLESTSTVTLDASGKSPVSPQLPPLPAQMMTPSIKLLNRTIVVSPTYTGDATPESPPPVRRLSLYKADDLDQAMRRLSVRSDGSSSSDGSVFTVEEFYDFLENELNFDEVLGEIMRDASGFNDLPGMDGVPAPTDRRSLPTAADMSEINATR